MLILFYSKYINKNLALNNCHRKINEAQKGKKFEA